MTMQNQWLVWLTNELIVVYIYFTMIQKRQKKEEQMKQTKKCEWKNLTFDCVNHSINECIELSYLS